MLRSALLIIGDTLIPVANGDGAGPQYCARQHILFPGEHLPARMHSGAETVLAVTAGKIELMVNAASGELAAGSFARIAPGLHFAGRNTGDIPAVVLIRTTPLGAPKPTRTITIQMSAA